MLLQEETKEMIRESRAELKSLNDHYRLCASDPSPNDFGVMDEIRARIKHLLEARLETKIHWERDVKTIGTSARSELASAQTNKSMIKFLDHPTKGRVDTTDGMMEIASEFYKNLYDHQNVDNNLWQTLFEGLPKLNIQNREKLEADLTLDEVLKAVREMPTGKAPGGDGITAEVWRVIFPIIGGHYIEMVNKAKEERQFLPGFLTAILTLLKKEGAIEGSMKSFRPISLMNLEYKILSKTLCNRLKQVMD